MPTNLIILMIVKSLVTCGLIILMIVKSPVTCGKTPIHLGPIHVPPVYLIFFFNLFSIWK